MKKFSIVLVTLVLMGCDTSIKSPQDISDSYDLSGPDLVGCKALYVPSPKYYDLYVIKCPLSQTTTHYTTGGKTSYTVATTIIDGVQYVKVDGQKKININGESYVETSK